MRSAESSVAFSRDGDLLTGESLCNAELIVDLGLLPVPGLFFPNADLASAAFSRVRLVKSVSSGLIQLDSDINANLYTYYKAGAVTPAHLAFVEMLADEFLLRYGMRTRILEIGGGAGHLMRALRKRGFRELYVVDPSAENRDTGEFNVIAGCFPDGLSEAGVSFDVVVAQHFLEHSCAPVAALQAARNLLSPTGEIWVEVPDIASSALSDGGEWLSVIYALHSSYFTHETLLLAGAHAGLSAHSIQRVNHYGKSLLAVFSLGKASSQTPPSRIINDDVDPVVTAIRRYCERFKQICTHIPSEIACWGAAERCFAVLGNCMASGFAPGPIIDSNRDLHGLYPSGMPRPVVNPDTIQDALPAVLMLSPRNAAAIVAAHPKLFSASTKVFVPRVDCCEE